jgi:hypothetical protein
MAAMFLQPQFRRRNGQREAYGAFGELFPIEYELLSYDGTSTYFNGQANASPLAKRGETCPAACNKPI